MTRRILDTSVAIAWYLPESFSIEARKWRSRLIQNQGRFLVLSSHFLEMAKVLKTCAARGELEGDLALEIDDTRLQAGLHVVEVPLDRVLDVALQYQCTGYDAAFAFLSIFHEIPLLTAERTTLLGDKARKVGRNDLLTPGLALFLVELSLPA